MAATTACDNNANKNNTNQNGGNPNNSGGAKNANQNSGNPNNTNQDGANQNGTNQSGASIKENTGLDIANLREADSVQVLFFTDPYGKDSLRYTRFFKHFNTSDTSVVNPLLNNLDRMFILRNEVMPCRSEGKLFFFKGEQELKTVYFNTQSLASASSKSSGKSFNSDCAYMYFIKDGGFYYFPIQPATIELLLKLKPKAVKP